MVLDPEPHAALAQRSGDSDGIAGRAASDQRRAERERKVACAFDVRRVDPRGVRRDAELVPCERLACDRDVVIRGPFRAQVRLPDVDRVEAERADRREQLVEPVCIRLDRAEVLIRRAVASRSRARRSSRS
jgi:hypothetical protein